MDNKENEFDDIDLSAEPAKILGEKQISDFVHVSIDEDYDVTIVDNFMGETKSILPQDEAIGVARFIMEFFDELAESTNP